MRELSLFTGAGGGLTGTALLGWTPIGYVEINEYCQQVIRQRIEDGCIPEAPIFGDIRTFTREGYARRYRGMVDIVTGGFPCQPFSTAGKQKGGKDDRNMWPETADVIRMVRPKYAFIENVAGLLAHEYIREIFKDLAEMGMDARWGVLGGFATGNITNGERIWIVAYAPDRVQCAGMDSIKNISVGSKESFTRRFESAISHALSQDDYTRIKRNPDVVAEKMEQLKAIGNGQMGPVVKLAWETLAREMK